MPHGGPHARRRDDELLFAMWLDWLPERDRLRAAVPAPEDEPWR